MAHQFNQLISPEGIHLQKSQLQGTQLKSHQGASEKIFPLLSKGAGHMSPFPFLDIVMYDNS